jgi:7-keto-8-aminopelargonate synthetase-like enzyme
VGGRDFGCSLFSSGYGVNLGVIPAVVKQAGHVVLDAEAHMSLVEGAKLSGGRIRFFRHNDVDHLRSVLREVCDGETRVLVCVEGVYSASGDIGEVRRMGEVCREHGALFLVDEAHSALLMGPHALGAVDEYDALDLVDFVVLTFSKSFGGVGGAVLAKRSLIPYLNWFSRTRFFSCALDPAVTGGLCKVVELALSAEGDRRRARLKANTARMRERLEGRVALSDSRTWLLPVIFGDDALALKVHDWLQRNGLDTSVMGFPATPKGQARARLFITSEHTPEQIDRAAALLCRAGSEFGFSLSSDR